LGILGLMSLPVEEYPEIAPPTVQVSATYTGANAETVLNSVVIPLEEEINGVEGMTWLQRQQMTVLQIFLFTLDWEQILISS
jgi:HAE1 family hydrophobic/amphiphilic exporter-1